MPKTKFQEVVFTILMVFVMVYAMICYNIALNIGGMSNEVFLSAFHELVIMGPAAFVLDFFIVGNLAKKKAFQIVRVGQDNPFHLVLAISVVSVIWMCPLMSLVATLLFKNAGSQIIAVWLETTVLNFPMAFCWQLFFAGPFVRFLFRNIFREKEAENEKRQAAVNRLVILAQVIILNEEDLRYLCKVLEKEETLENKSILYVLDKQKYEKNKKEIYIKSTKAFVFSRAPITV